MYCTFRSAALWYSSEYAVSSCSWNAEMMFVNAFLENKPISAFYWFQMQFLQLLKTHVLKPYLIIPIVYNYAMRTIGNSTSLHQKMNRDPSLIKLRARWNGKLAGSHGLKGTKYQEVPSSTSITEVLCDLPRKEKFGVAPRVSKVQKYSLLTYWQLKLLFLTSCFLILSTIDFSGEKLKSHDKTSGLKFHGYRQASNHVTLRPIKWCRLVMKFGLQDQRSKNIHYLTLGRFCTAFLLKAKVGMKTTMAMYVFDVMAKGIKWADSSIKVSPYRMYGKNKSMKCSV